MQRIYDMARDKGYDQGRDVGQLQEWKQHSQRTLDNYGKRISKLESRQQVIWRSGLVIVIWTLNALGLLEAEAIEKLAAAGLKSWLVGVFL